MSSPPSHSPANWTDTEKSALVQQLMLGGISIEQACSEHGLSRLDLEDWVRVFRRAVRQALDRQLESALCSRGLDVEESPAEISGKLSALSVADLLQTIQLSRKSAEICVLHDGVESQLWCEDGEIVDAESGKLSGEDALYRILALREGSMSAAFVARPRARRIQTSTPRLLLNAARHDDERSRLLNRIGSLERVLSVVAPLAARTANDLCPEELCVLGLFDGRRSIREILLASDLSDSQTLEIALRLEDAGLLVTSDHVQSTAEAAPKAVHSSLAAFTTQASNTRAGPPFWVLGLGALFCSSLGAATAIAYLDGDSPPALAVPTTPALGTAAAASVSIAAPACPAGMAWIAGGSFAMGSDSDHPALNWARPAHRVTLGGFCLQTREVTVGEYAECVRAGLCEPAFRAVLPAAGRQSTNAESFPSASDTQCNAGKLGREQHPINCVSFHQAQSYCASRDTRLATEAEWEFAARGEGERAFPWGNTPPSPQLLNACGSECVRRRAAELQRQIGGQMYDGDDGFPTSAPVGSFPLGASPEGVFDLIGNVFEWTSDGLYTYGTEARENPRGPRSADSYVIRGGSFNSSLEEFSNPALRFGMAPDAHSHAVGFRCARDPLSSPAAMR